MTRNIVLCLTSPALAAGEAEPCILRIQGEITAVSRDLDRAETDLQQGYRLLSTHEAGLIFLHDIAPVGRRNPDGSIRVENTHRWYWARPDDPRTPVSPDLLKQPIDPDQTRARIATLQADRTRLEADLPVRQAECRNAFTDQ